MATTTVDDKSKRREELSRQFNRFSTKLYEAVQDKALDGENIGFAVSYDLTQTAGRLRNLLAWFPGEYDDLRQLAYTVMHGWIPTQHEFEDQVTPIFNKIRLPPPGVTRHDLRDPVSARELADAWGIEDIDHLSRTLRNAAGMKKLKPGKHGRRFGHATLDRIAHTFGDGKIGIGLRRSGFGKPELPVGNLKSAEGTAISRATS